MWTRRDLKHRGRQAFLRNYWAVVAICFLLAFAGAEYADSAELIHRNTAAASNYDLMVEQAVERAIARAQDTSSGVVGAVFFTAESGLSAAEEAAATLFNALTAHHGWLFRIFAGGFFLLAGFVMLFFSFLVANPLLVGARHFLLKNRQGPVSPLALLSVFHRGAYLRTAWIMFLRWLYLGLWTLLLVVPGVIKRYEYRMVPFLLASNPNMDRRRIFALSRIMMRGSKWRSFVLDLSFLLWSFLSALTLGLAGIFFVNPYLAATEAELYAALRQKVLDDGEAAPAELPL